MIRSICPVCLDAAKLERGTELFNPINPKKIISLSISIATILMIFALLYYIGLPTNRSPKAENGQLNLLHWNFQEDGVALLNGEWDFYPESLLGPQELGLHQAYRIHVPGSWGKEAAYFQPARGNGTYHLSVRLPAGQEKFILKVQNIWMAHRLFINGDLVKEMGTPSLSSDQYEPKNTPYSITVQPVEQLDIIIQVSNLIYYDGGINLPIQLGKEAAMTIRSQLSFGLDMAGFFLFLLFGIYHLQMYQMRDKESTYLYSGIYLILLSFTIVTSGEKLFMQLLDRVPFELAYRVQDLSISSSFLVMVLFILSFEPAVMKKRLAALLSLPVAAYVLFIIGTPYSFYIHAKGYITIYAGLLMVVVAFRLVYILLQKRDKGLPFGELSCVASCMAFLTVMLSNATLYYSGYIHTNVVEKMSMIGFLISLNLLLARRFTNKMNEVQILSEGLKHSNAIKDEFLARTSHELKTPLHGVINISSYLLKDEGSSLTQKQRENISLIQDTSMKLSILVNDLIDATKLRHEDVQLKTRTVDLYVVLQIVFQLLSFDTEGKAVKLFNRVKPMTYVEADENRLRQILYNLAVNAVKYTERGEITAKANMEGRYVVFTLSDTGRGIPSDQWELVFQDSYRDPQPDETADQGMGLGLYISRQLARRMEGEIWISRSVPGVGTEFSLRLPGGEFRQGIEEAQGQSEERTRTRVSDSTPTARKNAKRILLVDDEPVNLHVLSLILQEEYELVTAHRGREALMLLQTKKVDLVIADLMMPGMSGIELTERIRQTHSVIELPIMIATVRDSEKDIELAYQAGANDYITKPFTGEEILNRARVLLQLTDAMEAVLHHEMAFLQAQIKPHFIYNALSNIIALCYEDGEQAAELLSLLSRYLRYIFQGGPSRQWIPLGQELDMIHAYVEIEKLRFGDRLKYETYLDPGLEEDGIMVPALLVQPLVENAIRHGLFNKLGPGLVSLSITEGEEFFRIVVEDDGVGMSDDQVYQLMHGEAGAGVGVINIRKRVEAISKASFFVHSELEKGTRCTLFLPKDLLLIPEKEMN